MRDTGELLAVSSELQVVVTKYSTAYILVTKSEHVVVVFCFFYFQTEGENVSMKMK